MKIEKTLFIIPARGGSKGLPRKNILPINGKPMICYTIDAARGVTCDENICVSTDDLEIKQVVESYGMKVPFLRPSKLAVDTAGTREVLLHAIDFYKNNFNKSYSKICLLQPTSPLRTAQHIVEAYNLWEDGIDMVVSVKESKTNPYTLNIENKKGFLKKVKNNNITRRQELPKFWKYNGAIYFINVNSLQERPISEFDKIRKYVMSKKQSVDVDDEIDYLVIQHLIKKQI